ncbi:uncharacterized protein BDR25DRAFT_353482 [Lindgomyces ingoldianus]|uniref:Uncharacterized protein n=1 Tax=Lindgomyces ingoldianus TaxID=673940 RepID=A0ACB6R2A0_9PLEO|nr:uncharacterized protein BDR25DRAFT_353482 [Lindgomyces ingoldianus]KAF2472462.1 hypothetical protein BDR25DRAFT_353482 [Lindgomyces ingoldianus]
MNPFVNRTLISIYLIAPSSRADPAYWVSGTIESMLGMGEKAIKNISVNRMIHSCAIIHRAHALRLNMATPSPLPLPSLCDPFDSSLTSTQATKRDVDETMAVRAGSSFLASGYDIKLLCEGGQGGQSHGLPLALQTHHSNSENNFTTIFIPIPARDQR